MGYSYSSFDDGIVDKRAAMSADVLSSSQAPPVLHELGPMTWGESRYYDSRVGRWVSGEPPEIPRLSDAKNQDNRT
jgi:hypothetical protein